MREEGQPRTGKTKCTSTEEQDQGKPVKAVMFVPYTVGSELAKRLRDAEGKLETLTGYRLKIVERAGTNLVDILTKSDPWQGKDCERAGCLLCLTKSRTGKQMTQDCTRRSLVYETWCMTCLEKDEDAAKMEAGDDMDKLRKLKENIKKYNNTRPPQVNLGRATPAQAIYVAPVITCTSQLNNNKDDILTPGQ